MEDFNNLENYSDDELMLKFVIQDDAELLLLDSLLRKVARG